MKVTNETIDHLAELSKLEFNGAEKEAIRGDLEKILGFIEKLNELDTSNVEPLIHITDTENVLRPDEPEVTITRQEALKNAPQKDSDFFKIPKVLDKK